MNTHHVKASVGTILNGLIDPNVPPVCEVRPGDRVVFDVWSMWSNASQPGLKLEDALLHRRHTRAAMRGPHPLTGPIKIAGAKPGDVLNVEIERLEIGTHGVNLITPGGESRGLLADMFPDPALRHFDLDRRTMTTSLGERIRIPLRPFLGIMGVMPAGDTAYSSSLPGVYGGNIDCPDLIAGTTLHLPVFRDGAGFYAGDAHASQGCGEIVQTALETSMSEVHVRLSIDEELSSIERPRASTREHLITMGFAEDLREAARQAAADMIDWVVARYKVVKQDAYVLCSLQGDLLITQLVNGINGVHMRMPKAIFVAEGGGR
ncbi:MAG: acetamidase/formamidase family protein [Xanthobacteraceae bacterium]|jgi:acetamidase/formamidase